MPSEGKTSTEPKICGSCGATFGCGAKLGGCWCAEVNVPESATGKIAEDFSDCLCPACLLRYSTEPLQDIGK